MKPYGKEVEKLIKIFKQAETELVREIYRQQTRGFVDYHTTAQLKRIQEILKSMQTKSFKYIPKMIVEQFYIGKRIGAKQGYANAQSIISDIGMREIQELVRQMETRVTAMSLTAQSEIINLINDAIVIGRMNDDTYRRAGIRGVIKSKAIGGSTRKAREYIVDYLKEHGITGFRDKTGKRWRLGTYANMVVRTTASQSTNLGAIERIVEEGGDLVKMSHHYGSCPICAPLQDRVYSISGKNPNYPPLAWAFSKIDKNGSDTLDNSWLTIHPNCRHTFYKWTEKGKSNEEIKAMQDKSSFTKNPPKIKNVQSEKEYSEYKQKLQGERKFHQAEQEWHKWKENGFDTKFWTFLKHKMANDDKYKAWRQIYNK